MKKSFYRSSQNLTEHELGLINSPKHSTNSKIETSLSLNQTQTSDPQCQGETMRNLPNQVQIEKNKPSITNTASYISKIIKVVKRKKREKLYLQSFHQGQQQKQESTQVQNQRFSLLVNENQNDNKSQSDSFQDSMLFKSMKSQINYVVKNQHHPPLSYTDKQIQFQMGNSRGDLIESKQDSIKTQIKKPKKFYSPPKVYNLKSTFEKIQNLFDEESTSIDKLRLNQQMEIGSNFVTSLADFDDAMGNSNHSLLLQDIEKKLENQKRGVDSEAIDPHQSLFLKKLQQGRLDKVISEESQDNEGKKMKQLRYAKVDYLKFPRQHYSPQAQSSQTFSEIEIKESGRNKKGVINSSKPNIAAIQKSIQQQGSDFFQKMDRAFCARQSLIEIGKQGVFFKDKAEENYFPTSILKIKKENDLNQSQFRRSSSPRKITQQNLSFKERKSQSPTRLSFSFQRKKKSVTDSILKSPEKHKLSLSQETRFSFKNTPKQSILIHSESKFQPKSFILPNSLDKQKQSLSPPQARFSFKNTPKQSILLNHNDNKFQVKSVILPHSQKLEKIQLQRQSLLLKQLADTSQIRLTNTLFSEDSIDECTEQLIDKKKEIERTSRKESSNSCRQRLNKDKFILKRNYLEEQWPHQDDNIGDTSFQSFTEAQLDSYYTNSQGIQKNILSETNALKTVKGILKLEYLYKKSNKLVQNKVFHSIKKS